MICLVHMSPSQFTVDAWISGYILRLVFCAVYCIFPLSWINHSSSVMPTKSWSTTTNIVLCGCCGKKMSWAKEQQHRTKVKRVDMVPTPSKAQATPSKLRLGPSPHKLRFSPFRLRYSPYKPRPSLSRPRLEGVSTEISERVGRPVEKGRQHQRGMGVVHLQLSHGAHISGGRARTNQCCAEWAGKSLLYWANIRDIWWYQYALD